MTAREADADRLSAQSYARNDPTGWFEELYAESARGAAVVPWDWGVPNAQLVEWGTGRDGRGRSAVVVGCGYGRDAEFIASLGYRTTGFDLSETAVRGARDRHPGTTVRYEAANLLDLPARYREAFDLVVESYTVQALPDPPRASAIAAVGTMVAPGGAMLVIAGARPDDSADPNGPPWPLLRAEVDRFAIADLHLVRVEHLIDHDGKARWRAEFAR